MSEQINVRQQAEQSVIGALLQRPELFDSISHIIAGEDFASLAHREIFGEREPGQRSDAAFTLYGALPLGFQIRS